MIRTYTCPHCGSFLKMGHGAPHKDIDSPVRFCGHCRKMYIDNNAYEWAVIGWMYKLFYYFLANNRWIPYFFCMIPVLGGYWSTPLIIMLLWATGCFIAVNSSIADDVELSHKRCLQPGYVDLLIKSYDKVSIRKCEQYKKESERLQNSRENPVVDLTEDSKENIQPSNNYDENDRIDANTKNDLPSNHIAPNTKEFWGDVRKIYAELFQITFEEFAPTMSEKGGASFDPKTFTLKIDDLTAENFYFSMCMAEMALFMRFVFRITFEQLSPNIKDEERVELNNIIDAGIDGYLSDNILAKRDDEYLSLMDETITVGYSRGDLINKNKNEMEGNDFIRRKAAIFFSDLIWMQGEYNEYLSLSDCLDKAKGRKVELREGLNNAKKAHGALTFSGLVYDALRKVFDKHC